MTDSDVGSDDGSTGPPSLCSTDDESDNSISSIESYSDAGTESLDTCTESSGVSSEGNLPELVSDGDSNSSASIAPEQRSENSDTSEPVHTIVLDNQSDDDDWIDAHSFNKQYHHEYTQLVQQCAKQRYSTDYTGVKELFYGDIDITNCIDTNRTPEYQGREAAVIDVAQRHLAATVEVSISWGAATCNIMVSEMQLQAINREVNTVADHKHTPSLVRCDIGAHTFRGLLDTGATLSIVSLNTVRTIGLEGAIVDCMQGPVKVANNSSMQVLGVVHITMRIGTANISFRPLVVRDLSREIIIGKEVLRATRAKLDMGESTVTFMGCAPVPFGDAVPEIASVDLEPEICEVWVEQDYNIPPKAVVAIPVKSSLQTTAGDDVLFTQHPSVESSANFRTWDCVVRHGNFKMPVVNLINKPITIAKGTRIGIAEITKPVATPEVNECVRDIDPRAKAFGEHKEFKPSDIKLGDKLTTKERIKVYTLLEEFRDIFTENLEAPGQLRVPPFYIDLIPGAQVKPQPVYRKPEVVHNQISIQTSEKVAKGVAEPSDSPCPAQVIMVPKKDGKLRQCVDLRHINSLTVPMTLEMPRIDDMFAVLRGAKYISLGDATWGYWQLRLKEEDRWKAAYAIREGNFQPTVMDFGMRNAPAFWQRTMNHIFQGLLWKKCLIYIDDLLVFSKTFDEHMDNMRECLSRCREYNLKLRPSKCLFFQDKLPFLGHMVSGDGLEMDEKKVEALTNTAPPINATKLNSFVCFAQYYREFIKGFADTVRPLRDLIAASKYEWTDKHQKAFNELKAAIAERVVLAHPYPDRPFILECDASNYGISYILSQKDDNGKIRAIAFGSRALTGSEQNFSTTERECLAVVEGVRKYHVYLYGVPFKVVTDHKALQWLFKHQNPTSKLMRWAIKLSEYTFDIEHRPGSKHANADALSRLVESEPRDKTMPEMPTVTTPLAEASVVDSEEDGIVKAQWSDVDLRPIIKYLRDRKLPKDNTKANRVVREAQHMELGDDGVLYHIWWPETKRYWSTTRHQVAIPHSWRARVLKECHDSVLTGGHLGFNKTHIKLRERYWWPRMFSDTRDYVLSCTMCQKRKGPQPIQAGEPQSIVTGEPWSTVGMDVFGPLRPKSSNGHCYILTFTDFTSKFVIAIALKAAGEEECADALVKEVICRHGVMKELVSDRGANFISHMMTEVYKVLKIHKINTTAWHPQGNGITERFNKSLADMLAIYIAELKRDWDELLPYIIFAYNASTHEVTKFTPYFLLFGKEPRFPFELALKGNDTPVVGGTAAYAEELVQRIKEAVALAKDNIALAQHKSENRASETRKPVEYNTGQKVWLYVKPRTKPGEMSAKLQLPWQGPFTVIAQVTPNVVSLKGLYSKVSQNVHVNRLKSYKEDRPIDEPTLSDDDEFDPATENAVNTKLLEEDEVTPDEEAVLEEITTYRVTQQGDLEYSAVWEGSERTWAPEVNVEHSLALEKFLHSKRTEPFFAVRIQLEKLQKRFTRKSYSPKAAVEQLCQCFEEYCVADQYLKSATNEIRKLTTMTEVRNYVIDALDDMRKTTRSLARKPPSDLLKTDLLPTNTQNKHHMSLRKVHANLIDIESPKRAKTSPPESLPEVNTVELTQAEPEPMQVEPTLTNASVTVVVQPVLPMEEQPAVQTPVQLASAPESNKVPAQGNRVARIDHAEEMQIQAINTALGSPSCLTGPGRVPVRIPPALDAIPEECDYKEDPGLFSMSRRFEELKEHLPGLEYYGGPDEYDSDAEYQEYREHVRNITDNVERNIHGTWTPPERVSEIEDSFAEATRTLSEREPGVTTVSITRELEQQQGVPDLGSRLPTVVSKEELRWVNDTPNRDDEIDKSIRAQYIYCDDCRARTATMVTEERCKESINLCIRCCTERIEDHVIERIVGQHKKMCFMFDNGWRYVVLALEWLDLYTELRHQLTRRMRFSEALYLDREREKIRNPDAWPFIREWCVKHSQIGDLKQISPTWWVLWEKGQIHKYVECKQDTCWNCKQWVFDGKTTIVAPHTGPVEPTMTLCKSCAPHISSVREITGLYIGAATNSKRELQPAWMEHQEPYLIALYEQRSRRVASAKERDEIYIGNTSMLQREVDKLGIPPSIPFHYVGNLNMWAYIFFSINDIGQEEWDQLQLRLIRCIHCEKTFPTYQLQRDIELNLVPNNTYCGKCMWLIAMNARVKKAVKASAKKTSLRLAAVWFFKQAKVYPLLLETARQREHVVFERMIFQEGLVAKLCDKGRDLLEVSQNMEEHVRRTRRRLNTDMGIKGTLLTQFLSNNQQRLNLCSACRLLGKVATGAWLSITWWSKPEEFEWVCYDCRLALRVMSNLYLQRPLFRLNGERISIELMVSEERKHDWREKDFFTYLRQRDLMIYKQKWVIQKKAASTQQG